jgi:hypothetical protein
MYPFELVPMTCVGTVTCSRATSPVARISLLGSRRVAWPGAVGCRYEWLRRARLSGGPPCGGSAGASVWGVLSVGGVAVMRAAPSRRRVRWPGREVAGRCRWSSDGAGSERRDERGREAIACGRWDIGGGRSGRADPADTIGQPSPGLLGLSFGLLAHGRSANANVCSRGRARCDDGVGEINTTQCGLPWRR